MIFHNRFVSQARAHRVPRGRRHLHHAVPQARADHLGHAGLRRRLRQGGHLDAVLVRAASCSPTGAACSCRWRDPRRRSPREVIELLGDDERRARARRARRRVRSRHGAGRRSRAPTSTSFERARVEHARSAAHRPSRRRRWPRVRSSLPELNLEHLRTLTDDTGILQHAIFTVPRYDDGYCLDDNARALLLMTLVEDAGAEDVAAVRALVVALPRLREPRVQRAARALPQLHVVRAPLARGARLRGQPRARAVGARHRRRPLGDPGRHSLGGELFHAALPATLDVHAARARGPSRCSASTSTCARSGRQRRAGGAHARSPIGCSTSSGASSAPDWPWFEDRAHLLQRAPVAGAASSRGIADRTTRR